MITGPQLELALARFAREHGPQALICDRCYGRPAPGPLGMVILTRVRGRWTCERCLETPASGPETAPGRANGEGGG